MRPEFFCFYGTPETAAASHVLLDAATLPPKPKVRRAG
jgi:hypothetical protein